MSEQQFELRVTLELDSDADAAEVEEQTLQVREELLELDVDDVRQAGAGVPPPGAKGVEAALVGTLLMTAGREAVGAVAHLLIGWLSHGRGRSVKLQLGDDVLELSHASPEERRQVVNTFLARHAPPSSAG
jgi:hypothetical protein